MVFLSAYCEACGKKSVVSTLMPIVKEEEGYNNYKLYKSEKHKAMRIHVIHKKPCNPKYSFIQEKIMKEELNGKSIDDLVWLTCNGFGKVWFENWHFHDTTNTFVKTIDVKCKCVRVLLHIMRPEEREEFKTTHKDQCRLKESITIEECRCLKQLPNDKCNGLVENDDYFFMSGKHLSRGNYTKWEIPK